MSSKAIKVTLADSALEQLAELAEQVGQPSASLAGQMIRHCIAHALSEDKLPTRPLTAAPRRPQRQQRPAWLEPYGGDTDWRKEIWGQVFALHARYPRLLAHLKDGWWNDEAHLEILSALACWRADLDEHATDPREELTFHAQLADYAQTLRAQGGGVTKTWKPGVPPEDWIA
ncbi:MAG: hypothetical protein ACYC0H_09175 [Solirubrobacteraceae bacterium]